jgi:hypothetical protein
MGVVASLCGPVATHRRIGKSARSLSSEEVSRTSHLRARCGPLYHRVSSFGIASAVFKLRTLHDMCALL